MSARQAKKVRQLVRRSVRDTTAHAAQLAAQEIVAMIRPRPRWCPARLWIRLLRFVLPGLPLDVAWSVLTKQEPER